MYRALDILEGTNLARKCVPEVADTASYRSPPMKLSVITGRLLCKRVIEDLICQDFREIAIYTDKRVVCIE